MINWHTHIEHLNCLHGRTISLSRNRRPEKIEENSQVSDKQNNSEVAFQLYLEAALPQDAKHTSSAIIGIALAQKIIDHLKGKGNDKDFGYFAKKSSV